MAMAVCPNGHDSASDDFCDVCGTRIASPVGRHHADRLGATGNGTESCPRCGAAAPGQFCAACGFNIRTRRAFAPSTSSVDSHSAAPAAALPGVSTPPSPISSSRPPESLFPSLSRPEPPPSPWARSDSGLSPTSRPEPRPRPSLRPRERPGPNRLPPGANPARRIILARRITPARRIIPARRITPARRISSDPDPQTNPGSRKPWNRFSSPPQRPPPGR